MPYACEYSQDVVSTCNHSYCYSVQATFLSLTTSVSSKGSIDRPNSLVMELLHQTLENKIGIWKNMHTALPRFGYRQRRTFSLDLLNDRLQVIFDIVGAMQYLHSKSVLLRDLKPSNCGFDGNGVIKLFDFGMALNLDEETRVGPDQYELEPAAGTLRYMAPGECASLSIFGRASGLLSGNSALSFIFISHIMLQIKPLPEVAVGLPYGKSCDVYSFALLLWETMSLEKPFATMPGKTFVKQVIHRNRKPKVDSMWPEILKAVMRRSWDSNPICRPSFSQIRSEFARLREMSIDDDYKGGCLPCLFELKSWRQKSGQTIIR